MVQQGEGNCWQERGAQAAFGIGPKLLDRTVHQIEFHRLDGTKFEEVAKNCKTALFHPNHAPKRLLQWHNLGLDGPKAI